MSRTLFPGALRIAALACSLTLAGPAAALDLQEAYRLAMTADANYLAAQAIAEGAREAVPQARAGLLPQLSLGGSRSRNSTDQTSKSSLTGDPFNQHYEYFATSASVSLRQPLLRLGNVANYLQAQAQVSAAEATLDRDTQAVAVRVASAYFDILVARERLDAVRSQTAAVAEQLAAAERSLQAGFGTRTDIDEARARHDLAQAQEIDVRHAIGVAERTLAGMLNQRVTADSLAAIQADRLALVAPQPDNVEAWLALAEETNPELRTMRFNIEVAEREIDKSRAGHLPTIDLVVNRSLSDSENNNTIGNKYWTSSIGVQLNIPIFAGGQVNSAIRQAHANLERARQQYEAGRRQLEVNLAREFGGVTQGIARVRALEQALRSAEQVVLSTRKGIQAGTRNNVDVLNALQQLATARMDLAQARSTYAVGTLKLKAAAGTLGTADVDLVNRWLASKQ